MDSLWVHKSATSSLVQALGSWYIRCCDKMRRCEMAGLVLDYGISDILYSTCNHSLTILNLSLRIFNYHSDLSDPKPTHTR